MKKIAFVIISVLSAIVLSGCKSDCPTGCKSSPFAQYADTAAILKLELKRTSQSWDGAPLPDYLKGKPELVVMRYIFRSAASFRGIITPSSTTAFCIRGN